MNAAAPPPSGSGARCFIALLPTNASRALLQGCRAQLAAANAGATAAARWVEPAALHLTLRFLGASTSAQIETCRRALPTLKEPLPAFASRQFRIWPNRARPRLLVLELAAHAALDALAQRCEALACTLGFAPEPRSFRAHVTIARLRPGCVFRTLRTPPPALAFDSLALLQSTLSAQGSKYTELARVAIAAAARTASTEH